MRLSEAIALASLHAKYKTPHIAVFAMSGLSLVLLLIPVLYASVYPPPAFPLNLSPYIDIVWIVIGIGVVMWLSRSRPEALAAGAQAVFADTGAASDLPR